ncbi:hypothetical protein F4680DRAFT_468382 [Xylaria scruposa]|nr:hypothetical protein F4680DRAFT_468382 [Xylaria scruposa]
MDLNNEPSTRLDRDIEAHSMREIRQNPDLEALHIQLLQSLFGLQADQIREWAGIYAYCEYLAICFRPLLTDQYAPIWEAIGKPSPAALPDCWPWFIAVSTAMGEIWNKDTSIEGIWKRLISQSPLRERRLSMPEQSACFVAVFSVICWATSSFQPKLDEIDSEVSPQFLVQQTDHPPLPINTFARRPVHRIFQQFRKTMKTTRWRHPVCENEEPYAILHVSSLEYSTLMEIGKIQVVWVSNISSHLDFDAVNRKLSIFRFPSFCALVILGSSRREDQQASSLIPCLELLRALHGADYGADAHEFKDDDNRYIQLHREVLMSYRLLFGQTLKSRRQAKAVLQKQKRDQPRQYDAFLEALCTRPSRDKMVRTIPQEIWPATCHNFDGLLQEESTYSSQDDFPLFGQRLVKLQTFSRRQQPSKLTDLWRDRRDTLQWYTFWAVLVVGGLSILLSVLQLSVSIAQLVTSLLELGSSVLTIISLLETSLRQQVTILLKMIRTSLSYLARDRLYEVEKPFSAEFEIEESDGIKKTNYILSNEEVTIQPVKDPNQFTLNQNGFCVTRADMNFSAGAALTTPAIVETSYLQDLRTILGQKFPEYNRIEPIEFVVRKRDERFPSDQLAVVTHEQPATLAHSDYSIHGAMLQLEASFPGQVNYFEGKEFDMIK